MYACMIEKISLDVPKGYGDDKDTRLAKRKAGDPAQVARNFVFLPSNLGFALLDKTIA